MKCRHCACELHLPLIDLDTAPPSNAYINVDALQQAETYYPLRILVCEHCWLVQTEDYAHADELFAHDYAYFSSFSSTWLKHCEQYVHTMVQRFSLNADSYWVEVAANDGYLLQYVKALGIPCLGIEPTHGTAEAARAKGIAIQEAFFCSSFAQQIAAADVMTANNVLAHVPEINDFVKGFALLLKPQGVVTFEFPHITNLIKYNQFDTIYHEHYSYLSFTAVQHVFEKNGLHIFDVETLPTHGGSLRVFAQRADTGQHTLQTSVSQLLTQEQMQGITSAAFYADFQKRAVEIKHAFLRFLLQAKQENKLVAAYGAAAKGNTLLNYAGVKSDLLRFVVDKNPAKQNKLLPGSRIPIVDESVLQQSRPDYVVIFPWNLQPEITAQLAYIREWGGKFVVAIPELQVLP